MKRYWITRFSLTKGVIEVEVDADNGPFIKPGKPFPSWELFRIGVEAFPTRKAAMEDAQRRCAEKERSLERQLDRLRALKIKVVTLKREG